MPNRKYDAGPSSAGYRRATTPFFCTAAAALTPGEINREIATRLHHKADIAVFPEGTTSDGTLLHGFHAALLQPAIDAGRPLLPLTLNYRDAHGNFSPAPSYAGEITLMQCFSEILACRALTVRILPASLIFPANQSRRALADAAHAAIARQLGL